MVSSVVPVFPVRATAACCSTARHCNLANSVPREKARYAKEVVALYAEGYPLFNVLPILILPISVKHTPSF